jgi:histidine ammonia-lyase
MLPDHAVGAPAAPETATVELDGRTLDIPAVVRVAREGTRAVLKAEAEARMRASRGLVERAVGEGRVTYGVNTGFGDLANVAIPPESLLLLQRNLLRSHCVGVGPPLPPEVVRAMMLLRVNSLAVGHSGVRVETARALLDMLAAEALPVVPSRGSVGASGDLAPLAHIALALIGEGEVVLRDRRLPAADALREAGLAPVELAPKEGLALVNGTQAMAAIGALALHDVRTLIRSAEAAAAMSTEALLGTDAHFDARIHAARPHPGQVETARRMRDLLADSPNLLSHRHSDHRVQDAYTLRCIPQVLGAVRDAHAYCEGVIGVELNSATDNPLCFPEDGAILNGGNFHGQPLALALDTLALATTQLGGFSERRVYRLLDRHESGLPAFLAVAPGVQSGMMVVQYTAAALASENKTLAHPASADSIPTSAGQEDYNSMGMASALKLRQVVENARLIVACELLCAAEGLEHVRHAPARRVAQLWAAVRETSPPLTGDRALSGELETLAGRIKAGRFAG